MCSTRGARYGYFLVENANVLCEGVLQQSSIMLSHDKRDMVSRTCGDGQSVCFCYMLVKLAIHYPYMFWYMVIVQSCSMI